MLEVKGINHESIVLDGRWVEKLRAGQSKKRIPASSLRDAKLNDASRKKYVLFGEREELVQVVLMFDTGMGLIVPAGKRSEVDRLVQELEKAKAAG